MGRAAGVRDVEPGRSSRLIATAGAILPPGLWAGSTFLLTWFLIGIIALGALIGRARPREAWLGAALFGAGFMILPFGRFADDPWPRPPTVEFLDEIRPWLPAVANGLRADPASITAANARIHEVLKQPVPMHFHRRDSARRRPEVHPAGDSRRGRQGHPDLRRSDRPVRSRQDHDVDGAGISTSTAFLFERACGFV